MSSKTETKQVNAYNPASMSAFNMLQPGIAQNLQEGMKGSKFQNLFLSQLLQGADTSSQAEIQNLMRNKQFTGFGGASMSPYFASQLARLQRGTSARRAQAQIQSNLYGEQMKQFYTQLAGGYNPLQTGGTSTQKKSGLGTWLPQVVGGALGFGLSGGFGKLFGGGGTTTTTSGNGNGY